MYKYTIARQLAAKRVITNRGDELGKLTDLLINEKTGDIEKLMIEVDRTSKLVKKLNTREKTIEVPYSSVTAVSDVFIVDERELDIASESD
jgi:sporulation protein YlmC with PRC-barrel domain